MNATTSNHIFETFEEELVTDDINNQTPNIEVISSTPTLAPAASPKQDEFSFFGNFVAEVMRNMTKPKSRMLQMNIMKLIRDAECES